MTPTPLLLAAVGLLLVGFAFKVSAVPFHMWTPDAYEGAPTIVTAFMSTGVKAAAFAAVRPRLPLGLRAAARASGCRCCRRIAAATMILGTVVGVLQTNVKRMLAYSSIAHAGYLLVGIVAANDVGKGAVLFYLLTYAVDQHRRVRRRRCSAPPTSRTTSCATSPGSVEDQAGAGRPDDGVPALARRLPADRPASSRKWYISSTPP